MVGLAVTEGPWQGQVARTREWFEPHLERIYDSAQVRLGDLIQLERLAQQFATRDQFLAELALDPPAVTGDLLRHAVSRRGLPDSVDRSLRERARNGMPSTS